MGNVTMDDVKNDYRKIKSLVAQSIQKRRFDLAISYMELAAHIMTGYQLNSIDNDIEDNLSVLSQNMLPGKREVNATEKRVILYDPQGNEYRGLVWIYADALLKLKYHVVYMTYKKNEIYIQNLQKLLEEGGGKIIYLKHRQDEETVYEIDSCISKIQPFTFMVLGHPTDIAVFIALAHYGKSLKKVYISMEDHGYCAGISTMDHLIEFRNYGYTMSVMERGIEKEKISVLPYYPIDTGIEFKGFDFPYENKKIIFSGGSLYKTEGSEKFYQIIEYILKHYQDTIFVFASNGNEGEFRKRLTKGTDTGRVFFIRERRDLPGCMKACFFYLSTYPIPGALMAQYASVAGRIPLTLQLKGGGATDIRSVLSDTDLNGIIFDNIQSLFDEIDRLMEDEEYKKSQEEKVKNTVITKEEFERNLDQILKDGQSDFAPAFIELNRAEFREVYGLAGLNNSYYSYYLNRYRRSLPLAVHFPKYCLLAGINMLKRWMANVL